MRDGLKYLAIPRNGELRDQLIGPEYDFNLKGELQLEKKSDMKKRGLASPDIADARSRSLLQGRCFLGNSTTGWGLRTM